MALRGLQVAHSFIAFFLNAIVEKNAQFAIINLSHLKSVLRYVTKINNDPSYVRTGVTENIPFTGGRSVALATAS